MYTTASQFTKHFYVYYHISHSQQPSDTIRKGIFIISIVQVQKPHRIRKVN